VVTWRSPVPRVGNFLYSTAVVSPLAGAGSFFLHRYSTGEFSPRILGLGFCATVLHGWRWHEYRVGGFNTFMVSFMAAAINSEVSSLVGLLGHTNQLGFLKLASKTTVVVVRRILFLNSFLASLHHLCAS
jgi:hypothetical protein